jgi:hypothetical protein
VKRVLLGGVLAYLLIGLVFAARAMPQQSWTCPDESAPHGYVTYGGPVGPPRNDCRSNVMVTDRVGWFALAVPAWLPLVMGKGFSNTTEP